MSLSLICIGDLHLKNKEPFLSTSQDFLNWLIENHNDNEMILLGDVFDSSAPVWEVYKIFKDFLLKRKNMTYLIKGNHDDSKMKGDSLSSFDLFDNVKVFEIKETIQIQSYNCLILPFTHDYKSYEELEGKCDFIFTHITPTECQFANEGIEFPKLKGLFIHGHTHMQKDFVDKFANQHCVLGTPYETRHLENQNHRLLKIKEGKVETIQVPFFFTHETINYGDEPTNNKNILNVKNAPNRKLVYEKYRNYYIRENGIELLRTESTQEDFKKEFEKSNILDKFKMYAKDKGLSQEVLECCSIRLSKIL